MVVGHKNLPKQFVNLQEVLNEIKSSAFKNSIYPVIIHLDINCSKIRQENAISMINNTLGVDNIVILPQDLKEDEVGCLLSPEELANKYILKCFCKRFEPIKLKTPEDDLFIEEKKGASKIFEEQKIVLTPKERQISEKVSSNVYLISGMKLDFTEFHYPWEIASIKSSKLEAFLQANPGFNYWRYYSARNLIDVVPSFKCKKKEDISVLEKFCISNTQGLWERGVQLVGIIRAIKNDSTIINKMLFYQGGKNCGYILKHNRMFLENPNKPKLETPSIIRKVNITILTIWQLPKLFDIPEGTNLNLRVSLLGAAPDKNAFDNDFQLPMAMIPAFPGDPPVITFSILYPMEAILMFTITCEGKFICKSFVPAMCIREGYRIVPLYNENYKKYAYSCIFGKFEIIDEEVK